MKVTIIGPAYPLRGGIAHHVYWLWRELTRRGHIVQVISFKKLYPKFLFPGKTIFDESANKLDTAALPVLNPMNPLSWMAAHRNIKAFAPDLAIVQWWNPFFAPLTGSLIRLLKRAGVPCLMECHNVLPHERRFVDSVLTRFAFAPLQHFITHSQEERRNLLDFYPAANVRVAPLPTIEEFSGTERATRDGRTALFFGIVRQYKGLDVLLRAMPKVLEQVNCHLLVKGEFYEPEERYQELVRRLGIERNVTIENRYISNEEVSGLLNEVDLLVLPYLSATQSAVARIALLNGLPIIASNTGGLSEVVRDGDNGFLFEPGDFAALANRMIKYFNEGLGPRFSANILNNSAAPPPSVADVIEEIAQTEFGVQVAN